MHHMTGHGGRTVMIIVAVFGWIIVAVQLPLLLLPPVVSGFVATTTTFSSTLWGQRRQPPIPIPTWCDNDAAVVRINLFSIRGRGRDNDNDNDRKRSSTRRDGGRLYGAVVDDDRGDQSSSRQKGDAIDQFLESVAAAVLDNDDSGGQEDFSFVILAATATNKKKKKKKNSSKITTATAASGDVLVARAGTIRRIEGRPVQLSKTGRVVIQVTFKYHGATDIVKNWNVSATVGNLETILRGHDEVVVDDHYEKVIPKTEWDNGDDDDDDHKKLPLPPMIQSAEIEARGNIYRLRWSNSISGKPPTFRTIAASTCCSSSPSSSSASLETSLRAHDRTKQSPLAADHPVWAAIGIATAPGGIVKPNMAAKYRQCQKFVEIVSRLVPAVAAASDDDQNNNHTHRRISIVDMGCGRGYLTFALHAHLTTTSTGEKQQHHRTVTTKGIDVRPKLVADMNHIAKTLAMDKDGLSFECGTIESFLRNDHRDDDDDDRDTDRSNDSSSSSSDNNNDNNNKDAAGEDDDLFSMVIALHACDTATDDALWYGIAQQADALVVAPCCHKQVRPQLDQAARSTPDHPYAAVLRHGIYRERMAETVTDALRALLLELAGYTVQVFEFVGGEHTSKNVMITAVKNRKKKKEKQVVRNDEEHKSSLSMRIQSLAQLHGIRHQSLADRMGVSLRPIDGSSRSGTSNITRDRTISLNGMPALAKRDTAA